MSTYSNYECLQSENTKTAINASGNLAKKIEILSRVPWRKLNLEPPICYRTYFFFFRQTQVFGSSVVKSKLLWQWAFVRFECHPLALLLYLRLIHHTARGCISTMMRFMEWGGLWTPGPPCFHWSSGHATCSTLKQKPFNISLCSHQVNFISIPS